MRENFIHKFHFFAIFQMSTGVADIYEPVRIEYDVLYVRGISHFFCLKFNLKISPWAISELCYIFCHNIHHFILNTMLWRTNGMIF